MRVYHAALLCVLATAALVGAAPPEVPAELTVGAGKVREFTVKADGKKDFGFRLVGGAAAFREMKSDDPTQRVFWLIPETDGPLSIVWWTVGEKASAVTEVNKGAKPVPPPVPPDPKPKPNPDPAPTPKADSVWVIVVEDASAARTVDVARALNDPFWAGLKPKHDFRHYLSSAEVAVSNGYVEKAKPVGYPAVLVLDAKDGDVLKAFKLTTVADLDAQVKAVTKP